MTRITLQFQRARHPRSLASRAVWVVPVCALFLAMVNALAEDLVVVSRSDGPGETRRRGTITDFTGEALTLKLANGHEEKIEPSRIVGYDTELTQEQQNGDRLFLEGRYADAVVSYRRAVESEQRRWMRRIILAQLARCHANMQQIVRAGDVFLLITRSDPQTQLLDALPLAWVASAPPVDVVAQSTRWLASSDSPVARLLGASWLLATSERPQALTELQKLTTAPDRRIAALATAQLWRDQLVTASAEDIQGWERQLGELDEKLRAGPYFLLGQAWARHQQHQAAALAFLRVPILYPENWDLVAESLFAAGEQLEKMGDHSGAVKVYTELVQTCKDHRLAPLAQQRLERAAVK